MMRRRCDRHYGFGPLPFFDGDAGGAPGGDPAAGGGAPPPAPPAGGAPAPVAGGEPDRSQFIPRDRFDEVNRELQARKAADEERERKEAEARGEHQKIADTEKAKREAAEARAVNIARRAAFVAGASGKVADVEAAYKLAKADGLLDDLDVDDDGNAKDPKKVEAIVGDIVKTYEFLKADKGTGRGYGEPAGGQNGGPVDTSKMGAMDMLSAGYGAGAGRRTR